MGDQLHDKVIWIAWCCIGAEIEIKTTGYNRKPRSRSSHVWKFDLQ
jgi:hypothetical protein